MLYSLRSKILLIVISLIVITSASLAYLLILEEQEVIDAEFRDKGLSLVELVGSLIKYPLLFADKYEVKKVLTQFEGNENVAYILVTDKNGEAVVHTENFTQDKQLKEALLEGIRSKTKKYPLLKKTIYNGKIPVYDLVLPVKKDLAEGLKEVETIGFVELGLSLDKIEKIKGKSKVIVLQVTAVVTVIGILISVIWISFLITPIKKLTRITREIARGNLDYWLDIRAKSEIGNLVNSFKIMVRDLKKHKSEAESYQAQIKESLKDKSKQAKKLERQLIQTDRLSIVKEFTGGIAHELKNPFTAMLGYVQLAMEKLKGQKELKEDEIKTIFSFVDFTEKEIKRCKTMIDDLLNFSRPSEMSTEPLNINEIIKETLQLLRPSFEQRELIVTMNFDENVPKIMGNVDKLKQVFINLFTNARKFLDAGGELAVYTALREKEEEQWVEIRVRDNGVGISEENLGKVFLPFFTTKKDGEGTGLGMSITYGIIKNHQGTISVESVEGEGTTFTITLPVKEEKNDGADQNISS